MALISSVRDGLKTRLQTISGLRAYDIWQGDIAVPNGGAALVGGPREIDFDVTMGRGLDGSMIEVLVLVPNASDRAAQDKLDTFLATTGAASVKAAIEGDTTLGGAANNCRVAKAHHYGLHSINDVSYLGVIFDVEVWL